MKEQLEKKRIQKRRLQYLRNDRSGPHPTHTRIERSPGRNGESLETTRRDQMRRKYELKDFH